LRCLVLGALHSLAVSCLPCRSATRCSPTRCPSTSATNSALTTRVSRVPTASAAVTALRRHHSPQHHPTTPARHPRCLLPTRPRGLLLLRTIVVPSRSGSRGGTALVGCSTMARCTLRVASVHAPSRHQSPSATRPTTRRGRPPCRAQRNASDPRRRAQRNASDPRRRRHRLPHRRRRRLSQRRRRRRVLSQLLRRLPQRCLPQRRRPRHNLQPQRRGLWRSRTARLPSRRRSTALRAALTVPVALGACGHCASSAARAS